MKRKLTILNDDIISKIDKWLKLTKVSQKIHCPFSVTSRSRGYAVKEGDCNICQSIFPSLEFHYKCPCQKFPQKYVRRVARKIIKGELK